MRLVFPRMQRLGTHCVFEVKVDDVKQMKPYVSNFHIKVEKKNKTGSGPGGTRKDRPPGKKKGKDRQRESHLAMPPIIDIRKNDWDKNDFKDFSALKVLHNRSEGDRQLYDFYINLDNVYLQNEMKYNPQLDPKILEAQYRYGMVLIGMSMLAFEKDRHKKRQDRDNGTDSNEEEPPIEYRISQSTEAISPVLLPMIALLSNSELEANN